MREGICVADTVVLDLMFITDLYQEPWSDKKNRRTVQTVQLNRYPFSLPASSIAGLGQSRSSAVGIVVSTDWNDLYRSMQQRTPLLIYP